MVTENDYIRPLLEFMRVMPEFLRKAEFDEKLMYFGTGESHNWPVQCCAKAFAALAIMGDTDTVLAILRYILATHLSGEARGTDGGQWGYTWISAGGSLERMTHGIEAIRPFLSADDLRSLRRVMLSEADWLLDELPVHAGIDAQEGRNKPESNIWNGSMLLRTAMEYPDAPRAEAYRQKGLKLILNGICVPSDLESNEIYGGKPLFEWLEGCNFTENLSLDHHKYLNVGYMVTCLSHIAILHFYCKKRGLEAPPEIYRNVEKLWMLLKRLTFPDGRLLRIGGDSRVRYAYCQTQCIPMWLFIADYLGDAEALVFEEGYLRIVNQERAYSGDGTFFSRRLARFREDNYQYYCRLESDMLSAFSSGAYYRREFEFKVQKTSEPEKTWRDEFHGAELVRDGGNIRSWVWRGSLGPVGLCVPSGRSDMAEWQHNLCGELATPAPCVAFPRSYHNREIPGGWLGSGEFIWRTQKPLGEGEDEYDFARQQMAVAALPDGKTLLIFDRITMLKETTLTRICGVNLKMPNDLFNGFERRYSREGTDSVSIDGEMSVFLLYGGDGLEIICPDERNIRLGRYPFLPSLYADVIGITKPLRRYRRGECVIDCGYAVTTAKEGANWKTLELPGLCRGVEFTASDSRVYRFTADFGLKISEICALAF